MNLYEHTIVARQDTSETQLKSITDKYVNIIKKCYGNVVKTEKW